MATFDLVYGKKKQLQFKDEDDLAYCLGYLTKTNFFVFKWEFNSEQNAWGNEGRIHVLKTSPSYPASLAKAHTKGNGGILHRINCNTFYALLQQLGYQPNTKSQDVKIIIPNIPAHMHASFMKGASAV